MSNPSASLFARELGKCLSIANMRPDEAVTALNDEGYPVPNKTFNYWLQGYFLPRSEAAFPMIAALEHICGIEGNSLSNALFYDLSSGNSFVPGEQLPPETVITPPARVAGKLDTFFDSVEGATDWEADLIRKVIRDEIRISADYTAAVHTTTTIALIPQAPNPSMRVSWIYEEGDKPLDGEYAMEVTGARMGAQELKEDSGVTVFSMNLYLADDDIIPGQLHTISYTWGNTYGSPPNRIGGRIFPWILDFYSCSLFFEGEPPESVNYVVLPAHDDEAGEPLSVTPLEIVNNRVTISAKEFGEVSGYMYLA